jgi:hypothetical protein
MAKEIDLVEVNISPAVFEEWQKAASRIAQALKLLEEAGREIPPIPDERARVEDDGTLTIYVSVPGVIDLSMPVPREHWVYRDKKKNN